MHKTSLYFTRVQVSAFCFTCIIYTRANSLKENITGTAFYAVFVVTQILYDCITLTGTKKGWRQSI